MKKEWKWVFAAAAVMLGGPFLAVKLVPGDGGMAVCFLLFFAVNPAFSVAAGWLGNGRRWLPAVVSGLFLVGAWCFFDLGETAFFLYAVIYLALGWAAMEVSRLLRRK